MKSIYILLTRSTTIVSRLVHFVTADTYTHVSFAFEEELNTLYSSSRKNGKTIFPAGPCKEYLHKGYYRDHEEIPCMLFRLEVTEEVYEQAKKAADEIVDHNDLYHYNLLGLVFCQFRIPYRRQYYYFCSEFAGEILSRSGALMFSKDCSLLKPIDYVDMPALSCCYQGMLRDLPQRQRKIQELHKTAV